MNDLNLIKDAQATMSSLEIAKLTGKRHNDVLRDIRNAFKEVGIGVSKFAHTYKTVQGKEAACYKLPRRECDLIVSGYSMKYRLAIIDRWHELESKNLPTDYLSALEKLTEEVRNNVALANKNTELEKQAALNAPKVQFTDLVTSSSKSILVGQFAKNLNDDYLCNIGANKLMAYLRKQNYLMSGDRNKVDRNVPYQKWIDKDYFESKRERVGIYKVVITTYVTGTGQVELADQIVDAFSL